ncbi:MAG TPA: hypothetical protein VL098_13795 [Flavipsychrobacter sp.]|nr:hypothetical protein [Flavipsychrobacter sp.]
MKNFLTVILFFLVVLEVYLTLQGASYYTKYTNSLLLFTTCLSIAFISFFSLMNTTSKVVNRRLNLFLIILFVLGAAVVCYYYSIGFHRFLEPGTASDVLPQLEALYTRFAKGEQPYYPVEEIGHKPYPVYMPAHWIIIAPSSLFGFDLRWTGLVMLLITAGCYFTLVKDRAVPFLHSFFTMLLFFFVILSFYFLADGDIFITFETPVVAYYLLLFIGLARRNLIWTTVGLILCLLSRYTFVFWLPLFALVILQERPFKQSVLTWASVGVAVLAFYIAPFILKDPNILTDGVAYHNKAAVADWYGYGEPPVSWSQETGISFGPYLKEIFSGDAEREVYKTRILQAILMILLNVLGWILYKRYKTKINYFDVLSIMLFVFMVFFYVFSPLSYRYYWITLFMVSAALFGIANTRHYKDKSPSGK